MPHTAACCTRMLRSPALRRVSIPPGNVSYGDMLNVSPFGNFLVVS